MPLILIVEDETPLAEGLRFNLELEGYTTVLAGDGETALSLLLSPTANFDAVLLDVMLPGIDGFEVASRLRDGQFYKPILMLTARNRPTDVLRGFEAGADDYLAKPFDLSILLARLKGLLRRRKWLIDEQAPHKEASPALPHRIVFAGKTIDFSNLELHVRGDRIHLTIMEADLLRYFLLHEGEPISRKTLLEAVWGLREDTDTRAIDNFIVRLRRYLEEDPTHPLHLLTVRGVGYRFVSEPSLATTP
jgi:two-component system alkaline phosphatase synthesis response regulator PhoP